MARVLTSAKGLIEEHGLDPGEIEGTGKNGSITKGDVEAHLARQQQPEPKANGGPTTAAEIMREGLLAGKSNQEILAEVKAAHPDSKAKIHTIYLTLWHERQRDTEWWQANRKKLAKVRPGLQKVRD